MSEQTTQTLQRLLEAEAQQWDEMAQKWYEAGDEMEVKRCRNHARGLRIKAAAFADRVVVRAEVTPANERQNWAIILREWLLVDMTSDATAALQARLTSEGRGWPQGEGATT